MGEGIRGGSPRILILRGGAIGDFILTLPVLQVLRASLPGAFLEVVGYPHVAELARAGGLVDRITSFHRAEIARLFACNAVLPEDQIQYLRSFDLILSYLYDPEGTVANNLRRAGVRRFVYCSPFVVGRHAVDHLLRPLADLGFPLPDYPYPDLRLSAEVVRQGRERWGGDEVPSVLVLHPGSGSLRKNWPLDRFVGLADMARQSQRYRPCFVLGEAEAELRGRLKRCRPDLCVAPELPLLEVAGMLAAAVAYVGNDSGITHLAAALGIPTVAIFGPTDPEVWGPRGPHTIVVTPSRGGVQELSEIPVEAVWDALEALMGPPRIWPRDARPGQSTQGVD